MRKSHTFPLGVLPTLLALWLAAAAGCSRPEPVVEGVETEAGRAAFEQVMAELAAAWNAGDATRAADCFTVDAVYVEPPDKQLFKGRAELFEFFGGEEGREGSMTMVWHHLAYNPDTAIGFGEFTFAYGSAAHGVAVVRIENGKIANWREYWYESELGWNDFIASNPF